MAAPAATATARRGLGLALTTAGCGFFGTLAATAYYYRPHPEPEEGESTTQRPSFSTPTPLCDIADKPDPLLMHITRTVTIGLVAAAGRLSLFGLNDFRVREDGRHARLVELVQHRDPGTPLITVSNHTTTLDDPSLFGVLMPWTVNARPDKVRWSACTQDICFSSAWRAAFFGAGKVMPIHRGGGVDQRLLQDLGRRVAAGEWCHVFPEGKCFQMGTIGGREGEEAQTVGRLKWGVGKLIARAPQRPIVVPIYHIGMERWFPINQVTKRLGRSVPATGQRLSMIVGEPIYLDDLLEEYERRVPDYQDRRARARALTGDRGVNVVKEKWASTDAEKELYSRITRRIEEALLKLEVEARAHHVLCFGQDALAPSPEAAQGP